MLLFIMVWHGDREKGWTGEECKSELFSTYGIFELWFRRPESNFVFDFHMLGLFTGKMLAVTRRCWP
jgi:hypothetical protein